LENKQVRFVASQLSTELAGVKGALLALVSALLTEQAETTKVSTGLVRRIDDANALQIGFGFEVGVSDLFQIWMVVVTVVGVVCFIFGMRFQVFLTNKKVEPEITKPQIHYRNVQTQSMTTYHRKHVTPRFGVVQDYAQGAWPQ
jgi:hypothetical protein